MINLRRMNHPKKDTVKIVILPLSRSVTVSDWRYPPSTIVNRHHRPSSSITFKNVLKVVLDGEFLQCKTKEVTKVYIIGELRIKILF
jgi:hypothetical protein